MRRPDMDRFTWAYAETALSDGLDEAGEEVGTPGPQSLAPETVRQMRVDCATFRMAAGDAADAFRASDVASDFWFERNGRSYGGFLDGEYPQPAASMLTEAARGFPPSELFFGEDGLIRSK